MKKTILLALVGLFGFWGLYFGGAVGGCGAGTDDDAADDDAADDDAADDSDDTDDSGPADNAAALAETPSIDPSSIDVALASGDELGLATLKSQDMPDLSAEGVGCMMDALFGAGIQVSRMMQLKFLCRMKTAVAATEISFPDEGTIYIQVTGIEGEEMGPPGDDDGPPADDDGGDDDGGGDLSTACAGLTDCDSANNMDQCQETPVGEGCANPDCSGQTLCLTVAQCGENKCVGQDDFGGGALKAQADDDDEGACTVNLKVSEASGTYSMWAVESCEGEDPTQLGYATYSVSEDDLYAGSVRFTADGQDWDGDLLLTFSIPTGLSITDSGFEGSISLVIDDSQGRSGLIITTSGASGTSGVGGTHEPPEEQEGGTGTVVGQWNSSRGCMQFIGEQGSAEVPVAISVDADTGEKTYSDTDDDSLCTDDMPQPPALQDLSGFEGDQAWDGEIPDTAVEGTDLFIFDEDELQELRGQVEGCEERSDFWQDAQTDPSTCFQ